MTPLPGEGTAKTPRKRAGSDAIRRAHDIAAIFDGFRRGSDDAHRVVRGWAGSVVHGGNWRFSDPEGVVQEVLVKLLQIARGDRVRDAGSFQKFVYTVAKNTCVTVFHRERRRGEHERPEADEQAHAGPGNPADDVERGETLDRMVQVFQRLPERCRRLWIWVYVDKRGAEEIAATLGITVNNLRVRVHRCLERARKIHRELSTHTIAGATAG